MYAFEFQVKLNDIVVRGPHWDEVREDGNCDGGSGKRGRVLREVERGKYEVKWEETGNTGEHFGTRLLVVQAAEVCLCTHCTALPFGALGLTFFRTATFATFPCALLALQQRVFRFKRNGRLRNTHLRRDEAEKGTASGLSVFGPMHSATALHICVRGVPWACPAR